MDTYRSYYFFISSMKPLAMNATIKITMMAMMTPIIHGSTCIPNSSMGTPFVYGSLFRPW